MHPVEALTRFGGVASRSELLRSTSRGNLERLVRSGDVVRDARGRYALPVADDGLRAANALSGVASHLSAAAYWGWEVKTPAATPHVTVPRQRRLSVEQRSGVVAHWSNLTADDVRDRVVTTRERTLVDCLTTLPFDEALAVADSALRHEDVDPAGLARVAVGVRGSGARQARRVAGAARGEAANPFESVLRAISLDVPGVDFEPQVAIRDEAFFARPDLVDVERMLVAEADSHTWHSGRAALRRDCRRYSALVVRGWLVVRFAWEDVMLDPLFVRETLIMLADRHARSRPGRRRAA